MPRRPSARRAKPVASSPEPGTKPPPSTRFNSRIPVSIRSSRRRSSRVMGVAVGWDLRRSIAPPGARTAISLSSTIVFHDPHPGQRPIHLGEAYPHS